MLDAQLLPNVTTRSERTLAQLRGETSSLDGVAITDALYLQLAFDREDGIYDVTADDLAAEATSEAEAFELARRNLLARSKEPWTRIADGLYQSPWNDSFDCARLALPTLFPRIGVQGDPIVTLPNRSAMLVTGSEELAGLNLLYTATRALAEQERGLHVAALRLDKGTWRTLDRRDLAIVIGVPTLGHLEFLQDALDHAIVGTEVRRALESLGYEVEPLHSRDWDGVVVTFTTLPRVPNVVIPEAHLIYCNGDFVHWRALTHQLGRNLVRLDVWPAHYQVLRVPTLVELQAAKAVR